MQKKKIAQTFKENWCLMDYTMCQGPMYVHFVFVTTVSLSGARLSFAMAPLM
ncbi:hypothetical protein O3M35_008879 [Rhynocoris fuscipes]|uniref:Uncharacterized protein n=1 Tax=Rhynocoris fuscipes TaxID=488301 RepID=A0AAW1DBB7_9HEMI